IPCTWGRIKYFWTEEDRNRSVKPPPNIEPALDPEKTTRDSDKPVDGSVEAAECPDLPEPMVVFPGLGNATFKPHDPNRIINTSEWGEVPANQVLVVAKENCTYCMVCEIAEGMKG